MTADAPLRALIEQWRELASQIRVSVSDFAAQPFDACADELEAALAADAMRELQALGQEMERPALLTDAQREALEAGVARYHATGVRGKRGKCEMIRSALQRVVSPWIALGGPGGPAMCALGEYLLDADARIRSLLAVRELAAETQDFAAIAASLTAAEQRGAEQERSKVLPLVAQWRDIANQYALIAERDAEQAVDRCADELEAALAADAMRELQALGQEMERPALLTDAQREALEAALAMDPGPENQPAYDQAYERYCRIVDAMHAIYSNVIETQARWLLAADARIRGAA